MMGARALSENNNQHKTRRRRVIGMALVLAGIATAIYIGFIMMGVVNAQ